MSNNSDWDEQTDLQETIAELKEKLKQPYRQRYFYVDETFYEFLRKHPKYKKYNSKRHPIFGFSPNI